MGVNAAETISSVPVCRFAAKLSRSRLCVCAAVAAAVYLAWCSATPVRLPSGVVMGSRSARYAVRRA